MDNPRKILELFTAEQRHHILFHSPVLNRLVVPFLPISKSDGFAQSLPQPSGAVGDGAIIKKPVFVHEPEYSFNDEYNQVQADL